MASRIGYPRSEFEHPTPPFMSENTHERHHTGLIRRLGTFSAVMVVVSAMIGSGVFKKVAPMSQTLGSSGWVLAAWVLAGLVTLAGALTNAEVAGLIAEPGGQYKYFEKMYGRFFAYIYGWTSFSVIQTATAASVAYVFAQSVNGFVTLPRLASDIEQITVLGLFTPFENIGVKLLAIGLIALLTAINVRGVQWGASVTNVLSSVVVVAIVLVTGLCFGFGNNGSYSFDTAGTPMEKEGIMGPLFTAMLAAFWAYEGWITLGFLGGEVKNPQKIIPRALSLGVFLVMALYVSINAGYLYVMTPEQFSTGGENEIAAVRAVSMFLGPSGQAVILGLILIATFSSTNNSLMGPSRIFFAMAHDGLFFRSARHCNASGVPSKALLMLGGWASVLVLSGSFDQLTDMLVFAAFLFYGASAAGVFVLRKRMPDAVRSFKVPFYPVLPLLFILFCVGLVFHSIRVNPREAIVGTALIASGLPFYFYFNRERTEEQVSKEIGIN